MDRAEVGDSRTATTSLQCGVEVGSQATLVQNVCERRGSHKLARCGFLGPEIYRNLHDRSVKCIGGLAFSGALVFTEGQSREPANPQPWIREQWLDPCGCGGCGGCGVSSALGIREVAISASGSAVLNEAVSEFMTCMPSRSRCYTVHRHIDSLASSK